MVNGTQPRRLGLLAGTFEDGSLSIYAVPEPKDLVPQDHNASWPIFGWLLRSAGVKRF